MRERVERNAPPYATADALDQVNVTVYGWNAQLQRNHGEIAATFQNVI